VPVEDEEHGGPPDRECPGFGPDDAPPPLNLWHGMFMVNNERAQQPGFLNKLLFRYEDLSNPCDPRNEPAPFLASLLNFGVLAFVLFRFGTKPISEALTKRKQGIMAEIEAATKLESDAEARLDDYEEKIEHLDAKLAELRADYAAQAEIEQKHVLAEAEERRVRMRRDAELRVEQEGKAAREALLHEAVIAATTGAEELIRKQIAAADHDRMATDFLSALGPALSTGGPS
jgi:F-type H+-transporting ATPase subunit b